MRIHILIGVFACLLIAADEPQRKADLPLRKGDNHKGAEFDGNTSTVRKTTAAELFRAYRTNDAFADENFTNKQVEVTGLVKSVLGYPDHTPPVYVLTIEGSRAPETCIAFRFDAEDRKQLVDLEPPQVVTICGLCEGRKGEQDGPFFIAFSGCRVVAKSGMPLRKGASIVANWEKNIVFHADLSHDGERIACLTGRLYLIGEKAEVPQYGNGEVVVELHRETTKANEPPDLQEVWRIDGETLQRVRRKDAIGKGYTLCLPWSSYSPDITRIWLKVRYDPPDKPSLYGERQLIILEHPDASK